MNKRCKKCGCKLTREWVQITDFFEPHWICLVCREKEEIENG